jgi:two-component system OmpR family sensor kinase
MSSDARPRSVPRLAAARLRRFGRRLGRVRFSSFSLRSRLLCLAVALVVGGLAVSDGLVVAVVRGQLVDRVNTQLERFAKSASTRPPFPQHQAPAGWADGGDGRMSGLLSNYAIAYALPDGTHSAWQQQGLSTSDPSPSLPTMTPAQLTAHTGHIFNVSSNHGSANWQVLILPASYPLYVNGTPVAGSVVVAVSLVDTDATMTKLDEGFLAIGLVVLLLISVAGWFAVRTGLKPLEQIETKATEIAGGHPLSNRMPEASHRTEVGRLSNSLNSMLDQIEGAFAARAASENRMRAFVADASHELRTPLAGIRGFAELYRMGALGEDADIKRTMARIESEAVRMGGLVEDLLTLARLDEQRPIELAPMDLRTLAADALHDTTALDPTRPVTLTGPGGGSAPSAALVLGDEARLRQVVTNLVGNAVRHTPPGTPVRIGVGTVGGHGVIEVADQGPGLTPEQANRVFERFYRVDASRSRQEGGGAGLGLAIVSALVTAHSGDVQVESVPGAGAVFRVRLPVN